MGQKRGFFISLEGGEGSGKSTMASWISSFLEEHGHVVERTREPGGTPLAEKIRSVLLTPDENDVLCAESELLLMYAARAQLVQTKIKPWLEAGHMVLSDRFDLSTIAYQGYGRGLDLTHIAALRTLAIGNFRPDLTLLFDIDVKLGMERVIARGKRDRFELEEVVFFERVRQGYLTYAQEHQDSVVIIDSSQPLASVEAQVEKALRSHLALA